MSEDDTVDPVVVEVVEVDVEDEVTALEEDEAAGDEEVVAFDVVGLVELLVEDVLDEAELDEDELGVVTCVEVAELLVVVLVLVEVVVGFDVDAEVVEEVKVDVDVETTTVEVVEVVTALYVAHALESSELKEAD